MQLHVPVKLSRKQAEILRLAAEKSLPGDGHGIYGQAAIAAARALERKGLARVAETWLFDFTITNWRVFATAEGKSLAAKLRTAKATDR